MSDLKTTPNKASTAAFLKTVEDDQKRKDCKELLAMMKEITSEKPVMWGQSIVGFGSYHYKYATGREGDWFTTGFSPRKQNLTIYIMIGFDKYPAIMKKLGKYKAGKSCLYVKKLDDIDRGLLRKLIAQSVKDLKKCYPSE